MLLFVMQVPAQNDVICSVLLFCPLRPSNKRRRASIQTSIHTGFTYLQSMDFQREPQSKHHLYCEQEKPAHCHGSLLLRLGTHQIQNQTRDAHKISPHGTKPSGRQL